MDDEGFWFPTPPHLKRRLAKRQRDRQMKPVDQCRYPDCANDKRRVQGAAYCAEHAQSIAYETRREHRTLALKLDCPRCARSFVLMRANQRTSQRAAWEEFCPDCRAATPFALITLVRHHVPPDLIRLWVGRGRELGCGLCGRDFRTKGTGPVLDHDHGCCAGDASCGKCIRGVLCMACNIRLGMFEAIVRSNLLPDFIAWLGAIAAPPMIIGAWARNPEEESVVR